MGHEFTREELDGLVARLTEAEAFREQDSVGLQLATSCRRLMDERDGYKMQAEVAKSYDAILKGESAWLVSNTQVEKWKAERAAHDKTAGALKGLLQMTTVTTQFARDVLHNEARAALAAYEGVRRD